MAPLFLQYNFSFIYMRFLDGVHGMSWLWLWGLDYAHTACADYFKRYVFAFSDYVPTNAYLRLSPFYSIFEEF